MIHCNKFIITLITTILFSFSLIGQITRNLIAINVNSFSFCNNSTRLFVGNKSWNSNKKGEILKIELGDE